MQLIVTVSVSPNGRVIALLGSLKMCEFDGFYNCLQTLMSYKIILISIIFNRLL